MLKLLFVNETKTAVDPALFKIILKHLPKIEGPLTYEDVEFLLTDDATLRTLNKQYRGKDKPTDVLSFSLEDPVHLGQLVISVDRAKVQAKEIGHSLEEELQFLFTHGLLHLLGYDHEKPEDEKKMLAKTHTLSLKIQEPPTTRYCDI